MTSPPLLLLVISLIPYVYLTESKTYTKSSSPPRTYYYRKITPSPTPPATSSPPTSFLEKLLYKKVSTLAGWMDSATSKYFPYVPHSGKYSGEVNPLTGDSYPWSKKTGKYRAPSKKHKTSPSTESSSPPAKSAKSLHSVDDTMDGILPLPQDLSDYWKSQLVSSDVEDQDSATGKDSVQMGDAEYDYETEDENSSRLLFSAPSVEGEDSATGKEIAESVAGSSSSIEHSPSKNMDSVKIDDAKYDYNSEDSAPSVEASSMEESKARMASSKKLDLNMEELINFVYFDVPISMEVATHSSTGTSTSSSVFKQITTTPEAEKTLSEDSLPSKKKTQPFFSKKEEVPIKLLVPEMVMQDISEGVIQEGDAE
eukprot:GFUD01027462.1.p1 GENE.GFUD01027462.1~~GFUD01027462.1.p1  ORF type:complete len:369 (+),score=108.12 GFUD01027462.1:193-1299(+)